jgi:acetyl esterase
MQPTVDVSMQAILTRLRSAPFADLRTMSLEQARQHFIAGQRVWGHAPSNLAETVALTVPGATSDLRARLYRPVAAERLPIVLYVHGGGWTFGDIDTHDGIMRHLAEASGSAVLGFDYRLAPEHPFPAPMDDCLAVLHHIEHGGLSSAIDAGRIALAGDSAGANIALGALITRREKKQTLPRTAVLFYGCFAPIFDTASHRSCGDGRFILGTEMMRWYWNNYLGTCPGASAPPACAPLNADLRNLPPLYLNAAGLDPLLDDTTLLSARLAAAGVRHTVDVWPGVVHGFLRFTRDLPAAREAIGLAGRHLAAALAGDRP